MSPLRIVLLFAAVAVVLAACGPRLHVRHQDPGHPAAAVWVDGEVAATLLYGDSLSVSLERGVHQLQVRLPESGRSPWHPDRESLRLVMDGGATLILLPPPEPAGPGPAPGT